MASIRDFVFGFRLEVIDHLSPVLKNVESRIKNIDEAVKNTAHWREAGQNLAVAGGAIAGVGAVLGYGISKVVDAAMKGEDATRHMMTAFDLTAPAAEQTRHLAETLKMVDNVSRATGISQDMLKDSVYNAKMMMLSDAAANQVAASSAKLAIGTTHDFAAAQAATADVSLMLATATNVLGGSASDLSDKFALLQSHYGFREISQLKAAMDYVLPSMKGLKMEAGDTFAAMAVLSTSGYQADRIGTGVHEVISKLTTGHAALRQFVVANKEGGLDLLKTTERLKSVTANMGTLQRASYLKSLGFDLRDVQVMETLLDGVNKFVAARADMARSKGTTDLLFNMRSQGFDQQLAPLSNSVDLLKEKIGAPLLAPLGHVVGLISRAVDSVASFAGHHPQIVKFTATFVAIGAAVAIVTGGILAAASAIMILGPEIAATLGAWALTAGIIGTALATAGADDRYVGRGILDWFKALPAKIASADWWKNLGISIVKGIGEGIMAGAAHLLGPLGTVAKLIIDHFPHSPARLGCCATSTRSGSSGPHSRHD